ncbi:MAG TPA: class III poly(R)-hydroxyalkanoic acid synthase subunit PhaE [Gemmatimonadales bacterium]|nr:class III poly(R)-hydroxyalkanoic acid synthase subunit PhaE [Gemmatimonadales bacterium]
MLRCNIPPANFSPGAGHADRTARAPAAPFHRGDRLVSDDSTSPFSTNPWLEAQRQYLDAWGAMWRAAAPSAAPAPTSPADSAGQTWSDSVTAWWRSLIAPSAPPPMQTVLAAVLAQGQAYLQMGETFMRLLQRMGRPEAAAERWQEQVAAYFGDLKAGFSNGSHGAAPLRSLMAFWELPLDTWRRTVSSSAATPGDFLAGLKPQGASDFTDDLHERLGRFLSVPALGYTREWQERGQQLLRLGLEYQRAFQDYAEVVSKLGVDAIDVFQRRLVERGDAGTPITTLREAFDLWVDAGEEAYAKLVSTDEYAEVYGTLVNRLMALKQQGRRMVDEAAGGFGLPTARDLSAVQRRQQELNREVAALRQELAALRTRRTWSQTPAPSAGGAEE